MLIDPGIDCVSFSITSTRPACSSLAITFAACASYVGKETEYRAVPNPAFFGGGLFVGDGRADDRRRHRDGDEGEDQELLTPLAPKEAPRPADDGATGGQPAIGRAGAGGGREDGGAHRGSFEIMSALVLRRRGARQT